MNWGDSRIRDGVRDSKVRWDIQSNFDRKIEVDYDLQYDFSHYGRVIPRSSQGNVNTGFGRTGRELHRSCATGDDRRSIVREDNRRWIRSHIPIFRGTSNRKDLLEWIEIVDGFFEEIQPPENSKCKWAYYAFEGEAELWWRQMQHQRLLKGESEIQLWPWMKFLLLTHFRPAMCSTKCLSKQKDMDCSSGVDESSKGRADRFVPTTCSIEVPNESYISKHEELEVVICGPDEGDYLVTEQIEEYDDIEDDDAMYEGLAFLFKSEIANGEQIEEADIHINITNVVLQHTTKTIRTSEGKSISATAQLNASASEKSTREKICIVNKQENEDDVKHARSLMEVPFQLSSNMPKQLRGCGLAVDSYYLWSNTIDACKSPGCGDVPTGTLKHNTIIENNHAGTEFEASELFIKKAKYDFEAALTHESKIHVNSVEMMSITCKLSPQSESTWNDVEEVKNQAWDSKMEVAATRLTFQMQSNLSMLKRVKVVVGMELQYHVPSKHEDQHKKIGSNGFATSRLHGDWVFKCVTRKGHEAHVGILFSDALCMIFDPGGNGRNGTESEITLDITLEIKDDDTGSILEQVKLMVAKVVEAVHRKAIPEKSNMVLTMFRTIISVVSEGPPELRQKGLARGVMQWYIHSMMTWVETNTDIILFRSSHDFSAYVKQPYIVALIYSPGTTVTSKRIELPHMNFIFDGLVRKDQDLANQVHNVFLCLLTMFHVFRLTNIVVAELERAKIVISMAKYELGLILKGIGKYTVTYFWLVISIILAWTRHSVIQTPGLLYLWQIGLEVVTLWPLLALLEDMLDFSTTTTSLEDELSKLGGWNDVNSSNTFAMAKRSFVTMTLCLSMLVKNGRLKRTLKLFYAVVNGLDPPKASNGELGSMNLLDLPSPMDSLVDELSSRGMV